MVSVSGGSRPSDNGGPGHPDPEIKWGWGRSQKIFFRLFGPLFGIKISAPPPPPGAPHLDPTLSVLHKELEYEVEKLKYKKF